jgi:hypothetical protein
MSALGRSLSLSLSIGLLGALAAPRATAEPTFLLHAIPSDFSACQSLNTPSLRCEDISVSPSGDDDYFAWVLVSDVGGEIGAAAFGITYDASVGVASWVGCTDQQLPYPPWPGSGGGMAMSWFDCVQTPANDMVKLGFFFVTSGSTGRMRITPHPRDDITSEGGLAITDCNNATTIRACDYNGSLVFDGAGGYVPDGCRCSGPPAVEASWSAIKNQYR